MIENKSFVVTVELLEQAEAELIDVLQEQNLKYQKSVERILRKPQLFLVIRWLGLVLCIAGLMLLLIAYLGNLLLNWDLIEYLFPNTMLFTFLLAFFWFLPKIDTWFNEKLQAFNQKRFKKYAYRCTKAIRPLVPCQVEYTYKEPWLSYFRKEGDEWSAVWQRELKGYIVEKPHMTVVFRKENSFYPKIFILNSPALPKSEE